MSFRFQYPTKLLAKAVLAGALGIVVASSDAKALTEDEAREIAVDAYVYFYPIITMDLTRKQFTNIEPGKVPGKGPMNMFDNVPTYPPGDFKGVVRSISTRSIRSAFLDLSKEPMVVSVPDTGGRYYLLPMLDMWTDVFASPGWRTTGTQAGEFLIAPATWRPDLRERFDEFRLPAGTQRIDAPTPMCGSSAERKTDGPADYDAVHKIQAGLQGHAAVRMGQDAASRPR